MAPVRRGTSAGSRPTGTDGADHQFRMVIEDRYRLIAYSKAQLKRIFVFQGLFLSLRGAYTVLSQEEEGPLPPVVVSLSVVGGVALLAGTIGLQWSSAPILRLYLILTVAALGVTIANMLESPYRLKVKQASGGSKIDMDGIVQSLANPLVMLDVAGVFIQAFAVYTTVNLVYALRAGRKKVA